MFGKTHFGILAASAVAGLAMLSAANAQANMILNGDFSANASSYTTFPGYSTSGYQTSPYGPTDWTISGITVGVNGPDTGFYASQGEPFAPSSTTGVRDFAYIQNQNFYIYQAVATTAGQTYTLNYAGAARAGDAAAGMNDVLDVAIANAYTQAVITSQTPAITDTGFNSFTLNFTATSASTAITFANTTNSSNGPTVDVSNVSLNPVPEPATLGLVTLGGMALLLIGRKRATRRNT